LKTNIANELLACASGIDISDVADGGRVILLPMGTFEGRGHGRSYALRDLAHAEKVVAATKARHGRTEIVVDYDHQSVFGAKPGVGGRAPAAGWIKPDSLQADAQGISGVIEWTAAASEHRKAREYRYISPYFGHLPDGAVTRLINVGLTNTPAIEELPAVAATANSEGPSMKEIAKALGLDETADEAAICAAIGKLNTSQTAIASALGLAASATGEELLAAATAAAKSGEPDPSKYVTFEAFSELQTQFASLQSETGEAKAAASVASAMEAGKVSPAMKDWALSLAKTNPDAFESFVATAAVIVPVGQRQTGATPPAAADGGLSEEDKAVCSSLGISEEDFLAQRKKEIA
jgi:phage I-like protein